jgi:hypothetical protein
MFFSPKGNPAIVHGALECALKSRVGTVLDLYNVSNVVMESLDVRYAATLGLHIGGGRGVQSAVVRSCDFAWIGGGCLQPGPRWKRNGLECTRSGNGIEISDWSWTAPGPNNSGIELAGLRLWEIYDAAISAQGQGRYIQERINFHHNLIGHSEYCFEIWAHGNGSAVMRDLKVDSNLCYNSGGGWSHAVRPDPSGRHICANWASDNITSVQIRNNIFYQSVPYQAGYWMNLAWDERSHSLDSDADVPAMLSPGGPGPGPPWGLSGEVRTNHNLWFQTNPSLGALVMAGGNIFQATNFSAFQQLTYKNGHDDIVGDDPLLAGVTALPAQNIMPTLRPAAASPARQAGTWTGDPTDIDGIRIPRDRPDMGPYQHVTQS